MCNAGAANRTRTSEKNPSEWSDRTKCELACRRCLGREPGKSVAERDFPTMNFTAQHDIQSKWFHFYSRVRQRAVCVSRLAMDSSTSIYCLVSSGNVDFMRVDRMDAKECFLLAAYGPFVILGSGCVSARDILCDSLFLIGIVTFRMHYIISHTHTRAHTWGT